tara:strand:- start:122 stop:475 length:354 start_codon:yes stop_codon:yes gene_type:complete
MLTACFQSLKHALLANKYQNQFLKRILCKLADVVLLISSTIRLLNCLGLKKNQNNNSSFAFLKCMLRNETLVKYGGLDTSFIDRDGGINSSFYITKFKSTESHREIAGKSSSPWATC